MYNSKLISLLYGFNSNEWKQFDYYLHSPYHNKNKEVIMLFEYVRKNIKKKKKRILDKELVFHQLYPKQRYNDRLIRQLMHVLLQAAEDFLALQKYKGDEFIKQRYLAEIYDKRNLEKHFHQVIRNLEKQRDQQTVLDSQYYECSFRLEELKSIFLEKKKKRKQEPNLQQVTDTLDRYYIIYKLRMFCMMLNYQNLFQHEYQKNMQEEIFSHLETHSYEDVPAIQLYFPMLQSLLDIENEAYFEQFKQNLTKYEHQLSKSYRQELHGLARNYCIRQLNIGKKPYIRELFLLYQSALEQDILWGGDYLSPWTYINIVAVGLKLKEYDWIKQFMEDYKEVLPLQQQDASYTFCLARFHFHKEDYQEVISLLHQTEIDDVFINLSAKTILLKTYYELQEEDALHSLLDSFNMYVQRKKKQIAYHQNNYLQIIRYTRRLAHLNPFDKSANEKLKAQIKSERNLTEKEWLLMKLESS